MERFAALGLAWVYLVLGTFWGSAGVMFLRFLLCTLLYFLLYYLCTSF